MADAAGDNNNKDEKENDNDVIEEEETTTTTKTSQWRKTRSTKVRQGDKRGWFMKLLLLQKVDHAYLPHWDYSRGIMAQCYNLLHFMVTD